MKSDRVFVNAAGPGQGSPKPGTYDFTPSPGSPAGRYRVFLDFFSQEGGPTAETTASAIFDVAPELGNLQILKFEDQNGNGLREAGEPGVPGWRFTLTNPQGNQSVATTGADGTVTYSGVPAGTWTVAEQVQDGWAAITPVTGTVVVPVNGTGTFAAGNARPAPLSGTVFVDVNRNGVQDAGEGGQGGVAITLSGTEGLGKLVSGQTATNANGDYEFPGLLPGSYSVRMTTPSGFTATTPVTITGIGIISAVPRPDNDFGIVSGPTGLVTGNPNAPNLTITKRGPAAAKRRGRFSYIITVRNPTNVLVRNVVVRDPLPRHMTLVSRPRGATVVNGVITWRVGNMRARTSKRLTMRVRINATAPLGRYTNTATVTATGVGPRRARTTRRVTGPRRIPRTGGVTG